MESPPSFPSQKDFASLFDEYGGTDHPYLAHHFERYKSTISEFISTWDISRGNHVVDIGAHWLHQSLLWCKAGFRITAVDMPITFEMPNVRSLAEAHEIQLVPCSDLESAHSLEVIPDSSAQIVLFTEIIEHLTFNPVELWKQVFRILAPKGRILITTPNYYAWNSRAWDLKRFLQGFGGGISVDDILCTRTYGHHWREFSKHEIIRYFCLLSPDFNTVKAKTMRNYYAPPLERRKRWASRIFELFPGLRTNLHIEVELPQKNRGIVVKPSW